MDESIVPPNIDIEPFRAQSAKPRGAVLVFPGGGYNHLAPHESAPVARRINAMGLTAFVVRYRHAPHRHPVPLQDARLAVRWVRFHAEQWNILPDQIAALGFSAGGHLAATLGTDFDGGDPEAQDPVESVSCRPDALVLCYAVVSLGEHGHLGCVKHLLGEGATRQQRDALSAQRLVRSNTPPAFLWHTADDPVVPSWHSLAFADAMIRHHRPVELHIFPHGRHGLGLAEEAPCVAQWPELCRKWLENLGF